MLQTETIWIVLGLFWMSESFHKANEKHIIQITEISLSFASSQLKIYLQNSFVIKLESLSVESFRRMILSFNFSYQDLDPSYRFSHPFWVIPIWFRINWEFHGD